MVQLAFTLDYVAPILDGTKTTTIRSSRCRRDVGDVVEAMMGARGKQRSFATLLITGRRVITPTDIDDAAHRATVARIYAGHTQLVELTFRRIS